MDEMALALSARKGPPLSKEEAHYRAPGAAGSVVVRHGLSSVGGAFRLEAVVRAVADDDGVCNRTDQLYEIK